MYKHLFFRLRHRQGFSKDACTLYKIDAARS
jgi:hypothetical protein